MSDSDGHGNWAAEGAGNAYVARKWEQLTLGWEELDDLKWEELEDGGTAWQAEASEVE